MMHMARACLLSAVRVQSAVPFAGGAAAAFAVAIFAVGMFTVAGRPAAGAEFNPTLNIGDAAPAWKNLPGTDGAAHSLDDLKDKKLVVVVFTCNSCPVATDYEDRVIALAKKHADKVAFAAINVNRIAEDSLPKMQERAREKGYPFAYLFDETQQIARDYGATFTPEFFVLGPDRKIIYMGGMDDNSDASAVKAQYLEPAIEAALAGEAPAKKETVARGCRIRYARQRK
jgi:peroxiredoxin